MTKGRKEKKEKKSNNLFYNKFHFSAMCLIATRTYSGGISNSFLTSLIGSNINFFVFDSKQAITQVSALFSLHRGDNLGSFSTDKFCSNLRFKSNI